MSEKNNKNRILYFEFIKVISIFIIFISHFIMDIDLTRHMHDLSHIYSFINTKNIHIGLISCAMFVLISGATLCISYSEKNLSYKDFIIKRLKRILIPYYIAYAICFFIYATNFRTLHIFQNRTVPPYYFIFTILGFDEYLNANGITTFTLGVGEWFLGCIIICYLFFPIIYKLNKKYKIATFIIFTIYFLFINFFYDNFNLTIPIYMNALYQIYNFYIGILLYYDKIKNFLDKYIKITLPISIITLILFCYININMNIPIGIKITFCSFLTYYIFSHLESFLQKSNLKNLLMLFNKYSYEFFLIHHTIIYQINFLLKYQPVGKKIVLFSLVIDFILTCLFAFVINILSKNIKYIFKTLAKT